MEENKTGLALLLIVILIGVAGTVSVLDLDITGQSIRRTKSLKETINAVGEFSGPSGTGNIQITFPEGGGTVSGQLTGKYVQGSTKSTYSGQISGTYYGGEGGQIAGTMKGTSEVRMGSRIQRGPFNGQFNGIVSLRKGTVTGSWSGTQMRGPFNLKFPPISGVSPAPSTSQRSTVYGTTTTTAPATIGYCRCITGERRSGIETSPYGGAGLRFQGFMTMQNCINRCGPTKYSWIER